MEEQVEQSVLAETVTNDSKNISGDFLSAIDFDEDKRESCFSTPQSDKIQNTKSILKQPFLIKSEPLDEVHIKKEPIGELAIKDEPLDEEANKENLLDVSLALPLNYESICLSNNPDAPLHWLPCDSELLNDDPQMPLPSTINVEPRSFSFEEKFTELFAKVDELTAMMHAQNEQLLVTKLGVDALNSGYLVRDVAQDQVWKIMEALRDRNTTHEKQLTDALAQAIQEVVPSTVKTAVKEEFCRHVPDIINKTMSSIELKVDRELAERVQAVDGVIKDTADKVVQSKAVKEYINKSVNNNLMPLLKSACDDLLKTL